MEHDGLEPYGWDDRWAALLAGLGLPGATPARVARHDGVALAVVGPGGPTQVPFRRNLDPTPVVGDWVAVVDGVAAHVLERASVLRRRDAERGSEQALVANLDDVLIVCGADRPVRAGRIQRFAALAGDAGATSTVVVTKADLVEDLGPLVEAAATADPGARVLATSSVTGQGLDELRATVSGRTVVMLGESGAGKSSLANALVGAPVAETGEVREGDAKGRHTTTARQLHALPGGGVLVDTPGVRAVGLSADPDAVSSAFGEIDELAEACRFADCAHRGEPGCAVAGAVRDGTLDPARLERWRALHAEAEAAARRGRGPGRGGRRRDPGRGSSRPDR
ncbi:MAG: ribosome small subunit-dependent GTPase A [Acidimicrobiia bacterium]